MPFRYHNQNLRLDIENMLQELKNTCEGKNISIAEITCDKDGYYSDKKLWEFLEELAVADYPDSVLQTLSGDEKERIDHEKDYLKNLLYLMIRSMQAKIDYLSCAHGYETVKEDSFVELMRSFHGTAGWPIKNLNLFTMKSERCHLLNSDMDGTIRSVYFYLTGDDKAFPDPYQMEDETASKAPVRAVSDASGSAETDDGLLEIRQALYQEEKDDYYHGDKASEEDWNEIYGDDSGLDDLENMKRRNHLGDTSSEAGKARLEKQKRQLQIFFQNKDEFIKAYERLAEITKPSDRIYADQLPKKIDEWLKKNGYMVYSDDEATEGVFELLLAATKDVERWQGKKL